MFLRAPNAGAVALLPSWHPAPAGEVCRKADRSLDKLQVCEGWGVAGLALSPATHVPPPRHAPRQLQRGGFLGKTWGASPNWGGSPAVSPVLRTYQKQRAASSILSGQPGFLVFGDRKALLHVYHFRRRSYLLRGSGDDKGRGWSTMFPPRGSANRPRRRGVAVLGRRGVMVPVAKPTLLPGRATHTPTGLLHTSFPHISAGLHHGAAEPS